MDREGFRNRLKQYKLAREENPGLKYWEWKDIPKYDEGTSMVGTPSVGVADFTNNLISLLSETTTKGFLNTIKRRLYDNLDPYNYSNLDLGERAQDRVINSVWKNKKDLQILYGREGEYSTMRDDIFAEYLNIPKENRHKIYNSLGEDISNEKHLVIPSKYKPSKTKNNNVEYKTIDKIKDKDIVESLDYYDNLNFNENATVRNNLGKYFGYYTVGRGLDPKRGEYISVYDLWDINPFYGNSGSDSEDGNWLDKVIHKKVGNEDASLGIGKPIEFYDRVYLDDYYGVDSKPDKDQYYGGYIPEVEITPKKYDEGGEVIGPPTYEDWYKDITKPTLNGFDDIHLKVGMEEAATDLHNMAMMLPGYAERWAEYQRSRPKEDPSIDQFVDDLWENENPNNTGYRNGKYYPHKSPEGGTMTIGPGFKIGSGSHRITKKLAERGMTKARLNQEARYIGKQHLNAVDQFINYGQTTNPADTVSPQIKMGLMDLRHLVGPLNTWHELRDAVLSGDLDKIKKESTVTWSNNGETKVDKRRKKIRDEKYFYYE